MSIIAPPISDIWDLSFPCLTPLLALPRFLVSSDMPVGSAVVASAETWSLAVTLISLYPLCFSPARTGARSACAQTHALSHNTHNRAAQKMNVRPFWNDRAGSDFDTVQTPKTCTSQLVQTSEILFKCGFAWFNVLTHIHTRYTLDKYSLKTLVSFMLVPHPDICIFFFVSVQHAWFPLQFFLKSP